jgi:DNA-binding CsgD family transcriptional regulator
VLSMLSERESAIVRLVAEGATGREMSLGGGAGNS